MGVRLATSSLIDTASLYELIETFDHRHAHDTHSWAWQSAIETTCLIAFSGNVGLAVGPTPQKPASDRYGLLRRHLDDHLSRLDAAPDIRTAAHKATLVWADRQPQLIRDAKERLAGVDSFHRWLNWCIDHAWLEKSARNGGLFDASFVPQISQILGLPTAELNRLCTASSDLGRLERLLDTGRRSEEFSITRDAYIVSLLMRGHYHDQVAAGSGWQIMHHPVRHSVLPPLHGGQGDPFTVRAPERYLAIIILASAFSQRGHARLAGWADNVIAARRAYRMGALVSLTDGDRDPVGTAVHAARTIEIRCHNEVLDRILNVAASVGFGYLTSITVQGWDALAVSALTTSASAFLLRGRNPSRATISALSRRPRRLRNLAEAGPGRLARTWETPPSEPS